MNRIRFRLNYFKTVYRLWVDRFEASRLTWADWDFIAWAQSLKSPVKQPSRIRKGRRLNAPKEQKRVARVQRYEAVKRWWWEDRTAWQQAQRLQAARRGAKGSGRWMI